MKVNRGKSEGELSPANLKMVIVGSSSNLPFYRELVHKKLGQALIYLTFLVVVAAVLLSAKEIYNFHRKLTTWVDLLEGNLPTLRIEDGRTHLEGDSFTLVEEKPFSAAVLQNRIIADSEMIDLSIQRIQTRLEGEERTGWLSAIRSVISPQSELNEQQQQELLKKLRDQKVAAQEALQWVKEKFSDPQEMLKESVVRGMLSSRTPPLSASAAEAVLNNASDGLFFSVAPGEDVPSFGPYQEGMILTEKKLKVKLGPVTLPDFPLDNIKSLVINDETLKRRAKLALLTGGPLLILASFVSYYVARLIQILVGCLVSRITTTVLKCAISFKQSFMISVYALTPVVILGLVVHLTGLRVMYFSVMYLIVYAVFVAGATRKCCMLN